MLTASSPRSPPRTSTPRAPAFLEIDITEPGSLNEEDAEEVGDDLPANSSALLIAFENTWAAKVTSALRDADAVLIDSIRIPAEVVEQALDQ